jgi:hypothetical protein
VRSADKVRSRASEWNINCQILSVKTLKYHWLEELESQPIATLQRGHRPPNQSLFTFCKMGEKDGLQNSKDRLQNSLGVRLQNSLGVRLQNSLGVRLQNSLGVRLQNSQGVRLQNSQGVRLQNSQGVRLQNSQGVRLQNSQGVRLHMEKMIGGARVGLYLGDGGWHERREEERREDGSDGVCPKRFASK